MPDSARPPHRLPARRRAIQAAAVALMLAAAACARADAAVGGLPPTATQEAGMTPGQPFRDPPDANAAGGSHLTVTLKASGTRFDLSGRKVWGQSYNGSFVAPTIHLEPGATATVTLVNHLPVATNLHFHGMHVSPAADDSFLCVAPGHTLHYHLTVPADHPIGTFWYHSHAMATTCPAQGTPMPGMANMQSPPAPAFQPTDVENQIFAGLSGALIVGDDRALLPPALRHIAAHTFVFKDAQIDKHGHIVQNTATTTINSNNPTVRLVNGQLRPVLSMKAGATQLWRLVNAGADIFYQVHLDGYHFRVVGQDGRPVAHVTTADTLLLPPAKRYDVLVTAGPQAGHTWLRTTAYSNGPQGDSYPDVPLTKINIAGHASTADDGLSADAAMPTAPPDLSRVRIAQHRTVQLSEDSTGTSFYINGQQFSMDNPVFATPAKLGTVEEWTILNTSGEVHPFHLHTNAFQVVSINGAPQADHDHRDVVPVPFQINGVPGQVVIRIPFADYTGRWMFHCHIAAHEDNGMMSFISVVS